MASAQQLYIGTNYHPHDWPQERWPVDIRLMKQAGFTTVRLGHLCWDSFEPNDGEYTFEWFDHVMDLFTDAGIGVVLDISMRPAPVWVHRTCPGVNIVSRSGIVQAPIRRYMEDVADPDYQQYAIRFAKKLIQRYRAHPALFAFGLCNELGDGYHSFSEYARQRFVNWLKNRYGTVEALNRSWATHRWSRRLNAFEDVSFPENEVARGQPEALLDMRRFFSDGIADFFVRLKKTAESEAPGVCHTSNHYAEKADLGFDYLKIYRAAVDFPGIGLYPGHAAGIHDDANLTFWHHRLSETGKPMWGLEFQTGCKGLHHCEYGLNRMYSLLTLLYRSQMTLAWTWRSMYGGEEQFLYGLLDHDGIPNVNYMEYCEISRDYHKLEKYALPYLPQPEIAVAYSRDSDWQCQYSPHQFHRSHSFAVRAVTHTLLQMNADFNIVDLRDMRGSYRLLVVPAVSIMDPVSAQTIRQYVQNGGTVVMTVQSAVTDETSKVFTSARPGFLDDVFGIRVAGFERPESGKMPAAILRNRDRLGISPEIVERIELKSAVCFAAFDTGACAVSENAYGCGNALYLSAEPTSEVISWLIGLLRDKLELGASLKTPAGVFARRTASGQAFYVNTNAEPVEIEPENSGYGVLREGWCNGPITLGAYDAEYIVQQLAGTNQ